MRDNIITAHAGEKTYIKTDPAFQYDYGLKLVIDGVELPEEFEVQFGNTNSSANKTVTGGVDGVMIPDEYLRNGEDIHAYVFLHTNEDDGFSVYHIHIPVIGRAAIDEEEITPVEHRLIDEALEKLAEAVTETEANVKNYPYINEDNYWMVYDAELGQFIDTGVKAQGDNKYNLDIGTVTTLPPGASATASMTWVGNDARLNLGLPIGDTSSLVSVYDEVSNTATVTIHDGADNIGVNEFRIAIDPIQEGSGTPGPKNIRRISGVSGVTLNQVAGTDETVYVTSFEDTAGTVYGGTFNSITGKLVVDRVLITKRCQDMDNMEVQPGWKNSGIREIVGADVAQVFENQVLNIGTNYAVDTTEGKDLLYLDYDHYGIRQTDWKKTEITVQICVMLAQPVEYTLDAYTPAVKHGDNTFTVTGGKIKYMKYPCDTKLYIDRKIAEVQALVLER